MPGYPATPTVQTVTDVLANVAPSIGNVAGYYVWLYSPISKITYGPSSVTNGAGTWSIPGVPAGEFNVSYGQNQFNVFPFSPTTYVVTGASEVTGADLAVRSVTVSVSPYAAQTLTGLSSINLEAWAHPPSGDATGATDYTNLQADINALPAGWTLKLWLGLYYINAALTIATDCTLQGGGVSEVFGAFSPSNGTVTPGAAPWLKGTVIMQVTAATNAITITGTGLNVSFEKFGIRFGDSIAFNNTGHGIYAVPTALTGGRPENGLAGGHWDNVIVFGHDGNHYAFYTVNKTVFQTTGLRTYGGGGWYQESNSAVNSYGVGTVTELGVTLIAGGSANAVHLKSRQAAFPGQIAGMTFTRPYSYIWNITGNGTPIATTFSLPTPLNTQYLWLEENTPIDVVVMAPDLQVNGPTGPFTFGAGTVVLAAFLTGTPAGSQTFPATNLVHGTGGQQGQLLFNPGATITQESVFRINSATNPKFRMSVQDVTNFEISTGPGSRTDFAFNNVTVLSAYARNATGGAVAINSLDNTAGLTVTGGTPQSGFTTDKSLVARAGTTQSANIQEWQDKNSAVLASVSNVGKLVTFLSAAANAGLNLPHGAAPTSPVDGDIWSTTAGLFIRINGVTKTVTLT